MSDPAREAATLRVAIWSGSPRIPDIAAVTARTEAGSRDWFVATLPARATAPDRDPAALDALLAPPRNGIAVGRAVQPDDDRAAAIAQLHAPPDAGLDGRLPTLAPQDRPAAR